MASTIRPVYLLAGGRHSRGKKPDPLLQAVFREAGKEHPSVAYVGAASGDDASFFKFISTAFMVSGSGEVNHALIAPDNADLKKTRDILMKADIVFISGGDVEAGMDILNQKGMTEFITGLYAQGKPFFGLSAGSIMLAREWVRWPEPDDDASAEIFPCLNISPVVCDTHAEADGWEELKALLKLEKEGAIGYGIPTGAGIKVNTNGKVVAVGGAVAVFTRKSGKTVRSKDLTPR